MLTVNATVIAADLTPHGIIPFNVNTIVLTSRDSLLWARSS